MKFTAVMVCVFVCGFSLTSKSQTSTPKKEKESAVKQEKLAPAKPNIVEDNTTVKVKENLNFNEGTIPTPEDQGFVKQTIDGKDTYFKEEGQMIIQYTPKK